MSEYHGIEAKQKAVEWGYPYDNIDSVDYARKSDSIGCKWVWAGREGYCTACGDMDWDWSDEVDD